jgi:hypothetical protein
MMMERFADFFLVFYAWKCVNCGSVVDETISANQQRVLVAESEEQPVTVR